MSEKQITVPVNEGGVDSQEIETTVALLGIRKQKKFKDNTFKLIRN